MKRTQHFLSAVTWAIFLWTVVALVKISEVDGKEHRENIETSNVEVQMRVVRAAPRKRNCRPPLSMPDSGRNQDPPPSGDDDLGVNCMTSGQSGPRPKRRLFRRQASLIPVDNDVGKQRSMEDIFGPYKRILRRQLKFKRRRIVANRLRQYNPVDILSEGE